MAPNHYSLKSQNEMSAAADYDCYLYTFMRQSYLLRKLINCKRDEWIQFSRICCCLAAKKWSHVVLRFVVDTYQRFFFHVNSYSYRLYIDDSGASWHKTDACYGQFAADVWERKGPVWTFHYTKAAPASASEKVVLSCFTFRVTKKDHGSTHVKVKKEHSSTHVKATNPKLT